jgi:hypothetical protein
MEITSPYTPLFVGHAVVEGDESAATIVVCPGRTGGTARGGRGYDIGRSTWRRNPESRGKELRVRIWGKGSHRFLVFKVTRVMAGIALRTFSH